MRLLFSALALLATLTACDRKIYVDRPEEELPDAGLAPDAETPPEPAPHLTCAPGALDFGPLLVGDTQSLLTTCTNTGDADLAITQIELTAANPVFAFDTGNIALPATVPPAATISIRVHYTPIDTTRAVDTLLITSNDPLTPNLEIPISGGGSPILRVEPSDVLSFSGPGPGTSQLLLANVGYSDLQLMQISITGPGGDPTHPSVDDFAIAECAGQDPCPTSPITLCPPGSPTCAGPSLFTLTVNYANNDISTVDFAELHLMTNDPADPEHTVVLASTDDPCLFPTPIITVVTPNPCVGMPVFLSASASSPGGHEAILSTIIFYNWSWLFSPAAQPAFTPSSSPTSAATYFVPTTSGVYIVGLDIENDCNAESPAPATMTINVAETCS